MIRKALIATAALAMLAGVSANQASAKVHVNVNFGFPGYGYGDSYPVYPVYGDDYYADDCGFKIIKKKKWNWNHSAYKIVFKKVWVCY